jgi:hypothetical protein
MEDLGQELEEVLKIEDIAERRFQMFKLYDKVLSSLGHDSVSDLNGFDGFLYKLSQDFLNSSSTYEKQQKLEKIVETVERKYLD